MIKNLFKSSLMILLLTLGLSGKSFAQELKFFTIGTGGTAYTYYPVGGMIANAISKPPGPWRFRNCICNHSTNWIISVSCSSCTNCKKF